MTMEMPAPNPSIQARLPELISRLEAVLPDDAIISPTRLKRGPIRMRCADGL